MDGMLSISDFRNFEYSRDDLGAARGTGIASLAGLAVWTAAFVFWTFLF
jgi:hypothetical protein